MAINKAHPIGSNRELLDARISELVKRRAQVLRAAPVNDARPAGPNWQLQEAKARFSEVVKQAREHGPQHITVRGERAVVLISEEEFARLTSSRRSIVDHILEGPAWPDDVVDAVDQRSRDAGRNVTF